MKATVRKGFTLIEILIVVIILGILAAIVIPQFTSASDDAKRASIRSTVQSIRGQIELYKLQHNDEYPTADGSVTWTDWTHLTSVTDVDGAILDQAAIDAAKAAGTKTYGPYLQEAPLNPFIGTSVVAATAAADVAWVFDADGRFWGVDKDGQLINQQSGKSEAGAATGS